MLVASAKISGTVHLSSEMSTHCSISAALTAPRCCSESLFADLSSDKQEVNNEITKPKLSEMFTTVKQIIVVFEGSVDVCCFLP